MRVSFCPNCGKETGHQRKLGFGTFFAVIITAGFWLLAIPFYPRRCTICNCSGLGLLPQPPRQLSPQQILAMQTKICPQCAESIKFSAQKCRYCGEVFDAAQVEKSISDRLAAYTRGAHFCPNCGHPFEGSFCPKCNPTIV